MMKLIYGELPRALPTDALLTTDDLIRSGACPDGVRAFRDEHFPDQTAVTVEEVLSKADRQERKYVVRAAHLDGDGDGYGYGYGDGYGYGYGDGDGYGYGYGKSP